MPPKTRGFRSWQISAQGLADRINLLKADISAIETLISDLQRCGDGLRVLDFSTWREVARTEAIAKLERRRSRLVQESDRFRTALENKAAVTS
jgi:hypothetical protein